MNRDDYNQIRERIAGLKKEIFVKDKRIANLEAVLRELLSRSPGDSGDRRLWVKARIAARYKLEING